MIFYFKKIRRLRKIIEKFLKSRFRLICIYSKQHLNPRGSSDVRRGGGLKPPNVEMPEN